MEEKVQKTRGLAFVLPNWVRGGMGSALVWSETSVSVHAGYISRKIDDSGATLGAPGAQLVPGRVIALRFGPKHQIHRYVSPGDRNGCGSMPKRPIRACRNR